MPARFLKGFAFASVLIFIGLELFAVAVDPFWLFNSPLIPGFNQYKPYFTSQNRMAMAHQACRVQPDTAIFGSSRVQQGFLMDDPVWHHLGRSLNMGMPGIMIDEIAKNLKHTYYASGGQLKTAIVGLDFYAFNGLRQRIIYKDIIPTFDKRRLLLDGRRSCAATILTDAKYYAGLTAMKAAFQTVIEQHHRPRYPQYLQFNGASDPQLNALQIKLSEYPFKAMLMGEVTGYVRNTWRPEGSRRYCFRTATFDPFSEFRKMVDFALDHHIRLYLYFAPHHAWFDVGLDEAGLYPQYQEWKQALADILAQEVKNRHAQVIPIWDFAELNPITTTPVSVTPDPWFFEGNHYRPALGQLMLDCMFGTHAMNPAYQRGFCKQVDAAHIKRSNEEALKALKRYEGVHKAELAPLRKDIDDTFAVDGGSNCGPTYRYLEESASAASPDKQAVLKQADELYRQEAASYRRQGLAFREMKPEITYLLLRAQALEKMGDNKDALPLYEAYRRDYPATDYGGHISLLSKTHSTRFLW